MFGEITIRSRGIAGSTPEIDLGLLVESLIFYRSVNLVVGRGALPTIVQRLGADQFARLVETDQLDLQYCPTFTAVRSEGSSSASSVCADLVVAEIGNEDTQEAIQRALSGLELGTGRARRLARRLERSVQTVRFDEALVTATQEDARDPGFVDRSIRRILEAVSPGLVLGDDFRFEVEVDRDGEVRASTNLDLAAATAACRRVHANDVDVTVPLLLSHLMAVHEDLYLAALFDSELGVPTFQSDLIRLKFSSVFEGREHSEQQLGEFQEKVFRHSKAIAEAVRSGEVDFADALDLVDKSRRFHEWISGLEPDDDLLTEYIAACTHQTWADRLPAKVARWALVTAGETLVGAAVGGVPGLVAGLVIGTGDFIVESRREGWQPNHFIAGPLGSALG